MVAKAIAEAQEKLSNKAQVTVEMVVQGLLNEAKDLSEGSTQSARVSAWAHLGKHLGMFKDKIEHTGPNGGAIDLSLKVVFEDDGEASTK